ncbi:hypothetical protein HanRHA438_Chr06g0280071 [Helianthus annuus]|nr:hypothetical protein HanRHA438_Chr06g0280071 [Helianthus annuus]
MMSLLIMKSLGIVECRFLIRTQYHPTTIIQGVLFDSEAFLLLLPCSPSSLFVTPQPMAESSGRGTERNRLFRSFHNNYHTIQLYNTSHTVSQTITSYHRKQLNNMGTVPTTRILNYYRPNVNIVLRPLDDYCGSY